MIYRKVNRGLGMQRRFKRVKAAIVGMLWLSGSMVSVQAGSEPVRSDTYSIAPMHYNRLAVKSDRILSVRGEDSDCQIESDPQTGDVYILPLTESTFRVFVTTVSGDTRLVTLKPVAKITQNIEITVPRVVTKVRNVRWPEPPESNRFLQKQAASIIKGHLPEGVVVSNKTASRIKNKLIILSPTNTYQSKDGDWIIYQAKNRSRKNISLDDWEWLPKSAKAVMSRDLELHNHGSTKVAIFWSKRGK